MQKAHTHAHTRPNQTKLPMIFSAAISGCARSDVHSSTMTVRNCEIVAMNVSACVCNSNCKVAGDFAMQWKRGGRERRQKRWACTAASIDVWCFCFDRSKSPARFVQSNLLRIIFNEHRTANIEIISNVNWVIARATAEPATQQHSSPAPLKRRRHSILTFT